MLVFGSRKKPDWQRQCVRNPNSENKWLFSGNVPTEKRQMKIRANDGTEKIGIFPISYGSHFRN